MKPSRKDLVWVRWQDAVSDSSRTHYEELSEVRLSINWNLGWIIHQNDRRIVLAHGYTATGEIDHFAIPTADILEIEPAAHTPRKKRHADEKSS